MPYYDKRCDGCGRVEIDVIERISAPRVTCECGGTLFRTYITKASGVVPDNVPGGIFVNNALCNPDGSPRRFDSNSEMHRYAAAHGWTNVVEHKGGKGTDKSKVTTRWVSVPQNEEERLKHWHEEIGPTLVPQAVAPLAVPVVLPEEGTKDVIRAAIREAEAAQ